MWRARRRRDRASASGAAGAARARAPGRRRQGCRAACRRVRRPAAPRCRCRSRVSSTPAFTSPNRNSTRLHRSFQTCSKWRDRIVGVRRASVEQVEAARRMRQERHDRHERQRRMEARRGRAPTTTAVRRSRDRARRCAPSACRSSERETERRGHQRRAARPDVDERLCDASATTSPNASAAIASSSRNGIARMPPEDRLEDEVRGGESMAHAIGQPGASTSS